MKREYIKPEAEMMKFLEAEEMMTTTESIPSPNHEIGFTDYLPNGWN